jgi:hypothetical protein
VKLKPGSVLPKDMDGRAWDRWNREQRIDGLASFTVATLPAALPAGQIIYVSNEAGGPVPAFSDGVNWRRSTDRAIVS